MRWNFLDGVLAGIALVFPWTPLGEQTGWWALPLFFGLGVLCGQIGRMYRATRSDAC